MKTSHHAAALVKRPDRVNAASKANVKVELPRLQPQRVLAQAAEGLVMAGIQRDNMGRVIKGHRKAAFEFGAQALDVWCQAGLCLALCPHQLGAEFAQLGGLPLLPHHQLLAKFVFPAFQVAPNMAVRQPQCPCTARN